MSKKVCIDPGHGGKDPGGGSNDQFLEKNKVLEISFEQKKHFERNGIKVVMTRTTDTYIDSVSRANSVKNSGAKYCISNHINSYNGKAEGAEIIHSVFANGKIAEGILKALVYKGAKYRRFFSKKNDSGGDWYFMHRLTGNVNTVLIEYGFADNKSDTTKIIKNWKKYAEAVAQYYIEHVFNQKYIPVSKKDNSQQPVNPPSNNNLYRVRKSWSDEKSQKGAFESLANAKKIADNHKGYNVYDSSGKQVYGDKTTSNGHQAKYPISNVLLTYGSEGEHVKELQRALNAIFFKVGKVDGHYGPVTKDAVERFQSVYLPYEVDGKFGPNTRKKLKTVLKSKGF